LRQGKARARVQRKGKEKGSPQIQVKRRGTGLLNLQTEITFHKGNSQGLRGTHERIGRQVIVQEKNGYLNLKRSRNQGWKKKGAPARKGGGQPGGRRDPRKKLKENSG